MTKQIRNPLCVTQPFGCRTATRQVGKMENLYVSQTTTVTIQRHIKDIKKTHRCTICSQDLTGQSYRQIKHHVHSHVLIHSCECGYLNTKEYLIKLHQKKMHPTLPCLSYTVDRGNGYARR